VTLFEFITDEQLAAIVASNNPKPGPTAPILP
jgi:hypothetical protein